MAGVEDINLKSMFLTCERGSTFPLEKAPVLKFDRTRAVPFPLVPEFIIFQRLRVGSTEVSSGLVPTRIRAFGSKVGSSRNARAPATPARLDPEQRKPFQVVPSFGGVRSQR
jgi:hypothetical protein